MVRHDLPRLKDPVRVLRVEGEQSLVHEIRGKAPCARRGCGQQEYPVSLLLIMVQILHQLRKAIIIGRDISGIDGIPVCEFDAKSLELHGRERKDTRILKLSHRLLHGVEHLRLPRQDITFFRPVCHALAKFQLHSPCVLLDPQRFVEIDAASPALQKIGEGHGVLIEIVDETVEVHQVLELCHLLPQIRHRRLETVRLLRLCLLPEKLRLRLAVLLNPVKSLVEHGLRQDQFRRRIN